MEKQCTPTQFEFHALGRREVAGKFDGGNITSDAGGLLLRETEKQTGILREFAKCFEDLRNPDPIGHTGAELIAQRVYGLALGYEDLNDHDDLRRDPARCTIAAEQCRMYTLWKAGTLRLAENRTARVASAYFRFLTRNPRFPATETIRVRSPGQSWHIPQNAPQVLRHSPQSGPTCPALVWILL